MGCTAPVPVEQRSPNLSVDEIKGKYPEYHELASRHRKSVSWKPTPRNLVGRYDRNEAFDGDCLQPLSYIRRDWYAIDIPRHLGIVSTVRSESEELGLQLAVAAGWYFGVPDWTPKIMDAKDYPRLLSVQLTCTAFGAFKEFIKRYRNKTLHIKVYHHFKIRAREWDKAGTVFFPATDQCSMELVYDVADTIVVDILPKAMDMLKEKETKAFKKKERTSKAQWHANAKKQAAQFKRRMTKIDNALGAGHPVRSLTK
jgi:hypothetical protein